MTDAAGVTLAELEDDPHRIWHQLRAKGPVVWVDAVNGWVIVERQAAVNAMRDAATFTVDDPRFSTGQIVGPSMLSTDGPAHGRHRGPFVTAFTATALTDAIDWCNSEATRLVASIAAQREAELRTHIAAPLAVSTIVRTLGLSDVDDDEVLSWYRTIVAEVEAINYGGLDKDKSLAANDALVAAARRTINDNPAGFLAGAAKDLTAIEVASNVAVIMFGAIETSEGATANALWHLLTHPEQLALVLNDPTLIPAAVEESLRLEPAASAVDRYATADTDFAGVSIRKGDFVQVSLAAANRDPSVFVEPDEYRVERPNTRLSTTFAYGPHACLGIHLARAETIAAVSAALRDLPGLRLDRGQSQGPQGLVFRKAAAVTATWDTPADLAFSAGDTQTNVVAPLAQ
jgi:cytochrome P450